MSSLLKDIYSPSFYERFADILTPLLPAFDRTRFFELIFDNEWPSKELKSRMRHTSVVLHTFFPKDFTETVPLIKKIINRLRQENFTGSSVEFMFLPDYIEVYGIDDYVPAVDILEYTTPFISCEYAVRPFILKYGDRMISQMFQWSLHPDHRVRRLATEGIRPRLPWAMALPKLKKDPASVLAILENLKADTSDWVRKSVANNLNDISKDNPEILLDIAKKWKGIGPETDAIIRHASRTLLKQGLPEILGYFGLGNSEGIEISDFKIITPQVKIGNSLEFTFHIKNKGDQSLPIRIEYGIYYKRLGGIHSKKVFKISEKTYGAREGATIVRKQSFKIITTRKFYPGIQSISLIINGIEKTKADFELLE